MGSIYRRGNTLWIKYYRNGVAMRESANTDKEKIADTLLKQREGDIARGVPVTPKTNRVTLSELLDDVLNDYKATGAARSRRSRITSRGTYGPISAPGRRRASRRRTCVPTSPIARTSRPPTPPSTASSPR